MTVEALQFGQTDITSCDQESVHILGSIQPHGILHLVDYQQLATRLYTGGTRLLLGVKPDRFPQMKLPDPFEDPVIATFVTSLCAAAPTAALAVLRSLGSRTGLRLLNVTLHTQGEVGIIELELEPAPSSLTPPAMRSGRSSPC